MTGESRIVRVAIGGRVQGVGYRAWTERQAVARGIEGWVRNRLNGDVEAVFSGPREAVDALCAACWRGPPHAQVNRVDVTETDQSALAEAGLGPGFRQIITI